MLDVHHMKLYGSFDLPWGLVGSFFYRHANGTPFNRTVTIAAPAEWAAANNALTWDVWVNLEPRGKRRNQSFDNLDIRFEKQFGLPFGKVGLFADIYNLLGNKYLAPSATISFYLFLPDFGILNEPEVPS